MEKFCLKFSVLPPKSTINHLPLCEKSEITFYCTNITVRDSIDYACKHNEYETFRRKSYIYPIYVYFTDLQGNWHCYDDTMDV